MFYRGNFTSLFRIFLTMELMLISFLSFMQTTNVNLLSQVSELANAHQKHLQAQQRNNSPIPPRGTYGSKRGSNDSQHNGMDRPQLSSPPSRTPPAAVKCRLCHKVIDNANYIQCPSVQEHRFCFRCCKDCVKFSTAESPATCPSGERFVVENIDRNTPLNLTLKKRNESICF